MNTNQQVRKMLEEIAQMQILTGASSFRASSNERAARAVGDLGEDLKDLAEDRDRLLEIDGVGDSVADKIIEFVESGDMKEHKDLREKVPQGLLKILDVPGIGPKTVKSLWDAKSVESLADLKKIIESGEIYDVPRLGKKTVENMKHAIEFSETSSERTPIGVAMPVAERIVEHLRGLKSADRVEYAGSLRRGKETVGDIDILVLASDAKRVGKSFRGMDIVTEVLAAGEKKSSVRIRVEDSSGRDHRMQVDLRVIEPGSFGAAMYYFTGSKEHNVRVREIAVRKGMTLNEYGLFRADPDADEPPQQRGERPVAAEEEADIFEALDLPCVPPEMREDRGELEAPKKTLENLIEVDDIRCELHAHTTASDGAMSIEALAEAAKERGFHTIAVTDHSKSQAVANGLDRDRLLKHIDAVREADEKVKGITILAGSEVDIMGDGSLDYEDDLLERLDIVVASPHHALGQNPKQATKRLLTAIEHPLTHIIGHPTGRLINRREGMSPDIRALAEAAAEHDTALEINAHWMRLDLRDVHVRTAVEAGANIAIDCDVHDRAHFDNLRFGVLTARRGWLTKDRCVNAWTKRKLHEWLKSKRS
jgi:DNA polymerase (family 10)